MISQRRNPQSACDFLCPSITVKKRAFPSVMSPAECAVKWNTDGENTGMQSPTNFHCPQHYTHKECGGC
jgi:hypothetical protein